MMKLAVFLILTFFSKVAFVSEFAEEVELKQVIARSQLILVAAPEGKPVSKKMDDGFLYNVQRFKVSETIYSKEAAVSQVITVSYYDQQRHDVSSQAKSGVNKIPIIPVYEAKSSPSENGSRILFLKKSKEAGVYQLSVSQSEEGMGQLEAVKNLVKNR